MPDWTVRVAGEVVRVERENVDKSGRNPQFFLTFVVSPSELGELPPGAQVPSEIPVRIKDRELARLTDKVPDVGDRVVMTVRANGPVPRTFYLTAIE